MKRYETTRDKIFKDFHFYQAKETPHTVRGYQYEKKLGNKETQTFRKHRESAFSNHSYTSMMNPLSRGFGRFDKPYKETYERKRKGMLHSDNLTDPLTMNYEPAPAVPKRRKEFEVMFGTRKELEQRY